MQWRLCASSIAALEQCSWNTFRGLGSGHHPRADARFDCPGIENQMAHVLREFSSRQIQRQSGKVSSIKNNASKPSKSTIISLRNACKQRNSSTKQEQKMKYVPGGQVILKAAVCHPGQRIRAIQLQEEAIINPGQFELMEKKKAEQDR